MDPVTHAASGAVAMLALKNRPRTAWAIPLAALACALPDIDLAFIHTPLEFLRLHRGITHSLAFMPVFGLVLAIFCRPLWSEATPGRWRFRQAWLFCCAMILLHIWLDVVTTYGTMVFLPFSHYRVRLNSVFIIDPLVTVPLLLAIWRWRARRGLVLAVLAWTFIYPASGIALNAWHTARSEARLAAENRKIERLHVLPDALAPFFWRVIFEEKDQNKITVRCHSLNALGQPRGAETVRAAAPASLIKKLAASSEACDTFFNFTVLPVMENLRKEDLPRDNAPGSTLLMFYDLRFGSGLDFVRWLMAMRPNADIPFLLMAELMPDGNPDNSELAGMRPERIRLRFSDSGRDSGWHKPLPPQEPTFIQWLAGLRY